MDIAASTAALHDTGPVEARVLRAVAAAELAQYWPLVKRGIETVCERSSDGWLVEDVYVALKQGTSGLFVGFVAQYYVGFVVVSPTIGWQGPQWHLWAVYNRGERDVLDTFLPDLLALARERGVTRLTMTSPRKGWDRRAEQLGWHYVNSQFAMEV